jgi:hypothetical protein
VFNRAKPHIADLAEEMVNRELPPHPRLTGVSRAGNRLDFFAPLFLSRKKVE